MAWHYAAYIEHVTAAGKAEYPLPMFANAALIRPNYEPGQYNSGGPLPHSIDVWRAAAPSLDFFSPDIYFNEFALWAGRYTRPDNPLFIPEAQGGSAGAANALYAFGHLSAIGFSPFGIDDQGNAPLDLVGITNPAEHPDNSAISDVYTQLSKLAPVLLEKQADRRRHRCTHRRRRTTIRKAIHRRLHSQHDPGRRRISTRRDVHSNRPKRISRYRQRRCADHLLDRQTRATHRWH